MARRKTSKLPEITEEDMTYIQKGYVSDLKASNHKTSERDLQAELLRKFDQTATIDAFEEMQGIKKKKRVDDFKFLFKNIILDPAKTVDRDLLNKLLNDPDFKIVTYKDAFSVKGDYKVFVIYGEKVSTKKKDPEPNE